MSKIIKDNGDTLITKGKNANRVFVKDSPMTDAFKEMHKIKGEVFRNPCRNNPAVIIKHKGESVMLEDCMKNGLTQHAVLIYKGVAMKFKTYAEAEFAAVKLLKEDKNG